MSDIDELREYGCRWYAIHTYNGYETRVKNALDNILKNRADMAEFIFDSRVPTAMQVESDGEKMVEKEVKLLPSYILVRMIMTDESWHIVRNINGVTGFVGPGSRPEPLIDEEVEELLGGKANTANEAFKVGDLVKIVSGVFSDWEGKIVAINPDADEVTVSVGTVGQDVNTTVKLSEIVAL